MPWSARVIVPLVVLSLGASAASARADEPVAPPPEPSPAKPPAPYSLPWHLRPAIAVTAVRSDTTVAFQDTATTLVTFLSASLKVAPEVAIAVRYGWVGDWPDNAGQRSAFTNVAANVTYAPRLGDAFRLAGTAGLVLPVAQGGGGAPDPDEQKAISAGTYARSAMDGTMFGPNDFAFVLGGALAYVAHGVTIQLESTLFHAIREKGEAVQVDGYKTNTTWGVHVGYFVVPALSFGAEIRYQLYLAPPAAVTLDPPRRDTTTAAIGARAHVPLGTHALHPGIAYAHPLDDPMTAAGYRIVQVDLPFVF